MRSSARGSPSIAMPCIAAVGAGRARHRPAILCVAQVEQKVEALPRRNEALLDALRRREEAAVSADEITAQRASALQEGELVGAGIGAVQDPEAVNAARRGDKRPFGEVDEQSPADESLEHLFARDLVLELALRVEIAVLQHQRNLG